MARTETDRKSKTTRQRGRDPETGEFRPADQARKKRGAPSDEGESVIPAGKKLGRAHD